MPNLSKGACILSIQHLFREAKSCHLWTFTFPDDVSPVEAARRWRLFVRWLVETERVCVRVLESGTLGGRWHYHCVTPDRWDVNEIREATDRYGFGRINVKKIPADRAKYVAKYLNKGVRGDLPKGQRRWACVGFKGVAVNRVRASSKTRYLPKVWSRPPYSAVQWNFEGSEPIRTEIRKTESEAGVEVQHHFISQRTWASLMADLGAGECIMVGEYRGLTVTQKVMADPVTKTKIETVIVEHLLECGRNQKTITEWLPSGADVDAVALPVEPGTLVKVFVKSLRHHKGQEYCTGVIKPLAEPSECRAESPQVA